VTAGGLFTKKTYPLGELQRPLTITKGMTELKAGVGFDISAKTAFDTFGMSLDGRYGIEDNLEIQAGFKGIYNFHDVEAFAGVEFSLWYDVIDFRVAARGKYCSPIEEMGAPVAHSPCKDPDSERYRKAGSFHLDVGFPIRYAPKPQVAVVALERLFTIDSDSDPDLTPSVGIVVQPAPIVSVLVRAQLTIPDFDTKTEALIVPATAAVQLALNNQVDIGAEFTLLNIKPPKPAMGEAPSPFDQRFLLFYGQLRL
jgi:hypothetical protein